MSSHIDDRWKNYRLKVIPLDAPELQAIECRRAYYAGAQAVIDIALGLTTGSQQAAAKQMRDLKEEVLRFKAQVVGGRA